MILHPCFQQYFLLYACQVGYSVFLFNYFCFRCVLLVLKYPSILSPLYISQNKAVSVWLLQIIFFFNSYSSEMFFISRLPCLLYSRHSTVETYLGCLKSLGYLWNVQAAIGMENEWRLRKIKYFSSFLISFFCSLIMLGLLECKSLLILCPRNSNCLFLMLSKSAYFFFTVCKTSSLVTYSIHDILSTLL